MSGLKVKRGDTVIVLSGKDKGKTGAVIKAMPSANKVIVEGVNVAKRHTKQKSATVQAGIFDKEMPIDASNVAPVSKSGKPAKVGYKVAADGTKTRFDKRSGASL
jgi:large subunit ribosomal protein L24